jgi:hypothetical protein
MEFAAPAALSTRAAELSTTCQSPPRPPSRRPPTGASGSRHYYDYDHVLFRAGWFLDEPHFGPQNGVRLTVQDERIRHFDRARFRLPTGTSRFVGDEASRTLQDLLYEVWELNERFVGEEQVDAFIQINGSPEQLDTIERGLDWARRYVTRRLARRNARDQGCPYRKFYRLYNELLPFLDQLGMVEADSGDAKSATVVGHYIGQMCDYIAWSFFEETWAKHVTWMSKGRAKAHRSPEVEHDLFMQCGTIFSIYSWKLARVFDQLLVNMSQALADRNEPALSLQEEAARIESLADDIDQMRPFLVRNFRQSKTTMALPGGLFAQFSWASQGRLGLLTCAESERELVEQEHASLAHMPLGISYRGLLSCYVNPWRNVLTYQEDLPVSAPTTGRVVLEALHAKLFSFYEQIDVDDILARWRSRSDEQPPSADDEAMVIAAAIASADEAEQAPQPKTRRIASSLRLSRLRTILEKEFGCVSRAGKGSEFLFYREGGRHALVGRHKANPTESRWQIPRILKKLGIGLREWIEVM